MADWFLQAEQIGHAFVNGRFILANVSLALPTGGFVALVGPSGIGKSTLLRILGGLIIPAQGEVRVQNGSGNSRIGIVFQQDNLMPWRTTFENVRLPLELQGIGGVEARRRVHELLNLVGLEGFEKSYPAQLSGGMAQRVALARALVHQPSLLLLDEPFGALDALTRERMGLELLRIRQAMPVTVFMVTHSIQEAVLLADEVLVMGGRPATIVRRIPVTLPRPRVLALQGEPTFYQLATAVRQAIEDES